MSYNRDNYPYRIFTLRRIVTGQPSTEPVTIDEMRRQARVYTGEQDPLLSRIIRASREVAERLMEISLINRNIIGYQSDFQTVTYFPNPPLFEFTQITYLDQNGIRQTVDPSVYYVDSIQKPAAIWLRENQQWPIHNREPDNIQLEYVAGYGPSNTDIPFDIAQALLAIGVHMYDSPGAADPAGGSGEFMAIYRNILSNHRMYVG